MASTKPACSTPKKNHSLLSAMMALSASMLVTILMAVQAVLAAAQSRGRSVRHSPRSAMLLMDETPLYPYDPNTVSPCRFWWNNDGDQTCVAVAEGHDTTVAQFVIWVRLSV